MARSAILDAPSSKPAYGRPMSVEEWEQMAEDEPGELVDGLLQEEEGADSPHEVVVSALLFVLLTWARPRGGRVLASETKYALSSHRGRKPDISVFLTRDRKLPRRGATRHPPDVMIEVVSPDPRDRRRDHIEKLREYAAFSVPWYWLVDPEAQSLEILTLGEDGRYIHALDTTEGTIEVPGCEGLTLDLDVLWRELDEALELERTPLGS
jgi:Uma2 family endonuclease